MKFQPHDIVRRVLPSGIMVGGLMVVISSSHDKCTIVRDANTGNHSISAVYDKLYANPSRFVCFILITKDETIRRTFQLGKISRVLRKVDETRKGYEIVPVKQPMYKLQLIGEL